MSHSKLYSEVTITGVRDFTFKVEVPGGIDSQAIESYLQGVKNAILAVKHSGMQSSNAILDSLEHRELLTDIDALKALATQN